MIKIVFFDIDGTLLPLGKNRPDPAVRKALDALQSQGILTFACSGRPNAIIPDFGFDGTIGYNGGLARLKDGTILFERPLPKDQVTALTERAKEQGKAVILCTDAGIHANFYDPLLKTYLTIASQPYRIHPDFPSLYDQPVYEMLLALGPDNLSGLLAGLDCLHATSWVEYACDIIHRDTDKGKALEAVCAALDIPVSQSMAMGDGLNDLEMIQAAGIGVAMGNAGQQLKEAAGFVTGTAEEDGVCTALAHYGLL